MPDSDPAEDPAPGIDALVDVLEHDGRVAAAWLFGSAARGALRPDSDVDVGVVYADEAAERSAEAEFLRTLGCLGLAAGRDVHLVNLERAGHTLCFQVFRRGRKLFDRDPRRTARLIERTMIERFDWEYARRVMDRAMAAWARRKSPGGEAPGDG